MHVPAGVPQGTRIGPWLFDVMINDLQLLSYESFHIWKVRRWYNCLGDRTAIMSKAHSSKSLMKSVHAWSYENPLQFNSSKCKELRTCFKRSPPCYAPVWSLSKSILQKILGVTIRQDLKMERSYWQYHCESCKALIFIKRVKESWS